SGFGRIREPFRELTELLRHAEQLAIRRLQPLIDRSLETVQLAALRRRQAEAPALPDQLGAPLARLAPRLLFGDPVQRVAEEFASSLFGREVLCGSPSPQLFGERLIEGNGQMHRLISSACGGSLSLSASNVCLVK